MNTKETLVALEEVRNAISHCLPDDMIIISAEVAAHGGPRVHILMPEEFRRLFSKFNISIDEGHGEYQQLSIVTHGVEFSCLELKAPVPLEDVQVPTEVISGLSGQEVPSE